MTRQVGREKRLPQRGQRRLNRTSLIVMALAALLIAGGLCFAFYPFLSRAITSWMPSAETGAKRKPAHPGTAKPTTTSSSQAVGPALAPAPRRPQTHLCGQAGWPERLVDGGSYVVQNDEWNSTAPECVTTDGGAQFRVASSSIHEPTARDPGGYPAIFSGCSAGVCTTGNKMPIRVSDLRPGTVTSSWATAQPPSGAYDVAYDIWFNRTRVTSGVPDGGELMIWLAHRGGPSVAPSGGPVAHTTIDGHAYTIWVGQGGGGPSFSYVMDGPVTSVKDLDIGAIAADASSRGYIAGSSYLLNVQAGFEIWQGGRGLETKSFAINVK